jgi:bacterial leucyl aminopeptidase
MATVFFTEGVLGSFVSNGHNTSFEMQQLLESLRQRNVQLGLVTNPTNDSREIIGDQKNGIMTFFDPTLVTSGALSIEQRLSDAASKAEAFRDRAIFVAKHNVERSAGLKAGFDVVVPHPQLVPEVLDGEALIYARVSGLDGDYTDGRVLRFLKTPTVPVYFTRQPEAHAYVITSKRAAKWIANMGFDITTLGEDGDPQFTDPYLVRDESYDPDEAKQTRATMEILGQQHKAYLVLGIEEGGPILALPPDVDIEKLDLSMSDPHSRRLLPDPTLLGQLAIHPKTAPSRPCLKLDPAAALNKRELEALQTMVTPATIEFYHAPYVGLAPLVTGGNKYDIKSRHIAHDQNKIVTSALLEQFKAIGGGLLKVRPDDFALATDVLTNVEAELPGVEKDSFVIISAHLDSISANVPNHKEYPAPGGDDDGSGMAAVLAAAVVAVTLTRELGPFKRSLRFVLFNAEEEHILGSAEYAAKQATANAKIEGVFEMDMIGFEGGQKNVFEIHYGFDRCADTEKCSAALAQRVRDMADIVSKPLVNAASPQFYPRNNVRDPAQGNGDHSRFHEHGYAACMISEDHNPDPLPDPAPRSNPNYHMTTDQHINYLYAAEIARAVIAAAFLTARAELSPGRL